MVAFAGCSLPQETKTIVTLSSRVMNPAADGISVVSIEIKPNDSVVAEKLERFGEPVVDVQLQEKLLQDGIQLRKVSTIDLPAIITSIGEVNQESSVWHGQILKWRDLHQRQINPEGMIISQQGIPYFIQRGILSLLCRSWLIEREDGLYIYVQCVPTWHVSREQSAIVGQTNKPIQSEIFKELGFETLLRDDEAIVVAVVLSGPKEKSGPQPEGPLAVRLGEALLGGPTKQDIVQFLVIEANIMPRG
jgi:hypothetical protein